MKRLIASYIARGSTRGESHGGIYLIDLEQQATYRPVDWNLSTIEWREYEGDRGLRGLAIDGETIYVASSHELTAFSRDFRLKKSWQHPCLRNCQDICIWQRTLFVVSAGSDCVLAFDLDQGKFQWVMHISRKEFQFIPRMIEPESNDGPLMLDKLKLNSLYCDANGMYISGSDSGGMLHFNGKKLHMAAELPSGSHNARPFRSGVLFNDSQAGVVRYCGRDDIKEDRAMTIPLRTAKPVDNVESQASTGKSGLVGQDGYGRGLCALSDRVVAVGSTPATVTLYDLAANTQLVSVVLSKDVRQSIHSLAVWPFD